MRIACGFLLTLLASGQDLAVLERELARLSAGAAGQMGIAAIHVESGRKAAVHADTPHQMASAYKIPIAITLLARVDSGTDKLDRMVTLQPDDYHIGSGTLTALFNPPGVTTPGVALSLRHLLELMLLISDNSATDVLLREVGGPAAVNQKLKDLGITGIRVDGPTNEMIREWRGSEKTYQDNPKNSSTPNGMAQLLVKLAKGEALPPASTELLLDILKRCQTGSARLKGILPEGTVVRHKTGTLSGVTNDVGIIELPDGAGRVAIAVFIQHSSATSEKRERAIAEAARAAHDYFLFVR
jgi:beta-lactamase class A